MSKYLQLFGIFFPSWKFFSAPEAIPHLAVRAHDESGWISCLDPAPARSWKQLFLNAEENELLASHSLLSRCAHELEEEGHPDVLLTVIARIAAATLARKRVAVSGFQFKITLEEKELYLSPPLEVPA